MKVHYSIIIFMTFLLIPPAFSKTKNDTPTSDYKKEKIQGSTVLINPEVFKHKKEAEEVLTELKTQLKAITGVMPKKTLKVLRKIRIWVEWEQRKDRAAEYHFSAKWLKNNGYNPKKARCIEIANSVNFVKWSRGEQPWALLHELSHAYQHQKLQKKDKSIKEAFNKAVASKSYDSVDYIKGGKKLKAYAMTSHWEYFAELSEAYFGKNDFYPFTNEDLKQHDPTGYKLMEKCWGKVSK